MNLLNLFPVPVAIFKSDRVLSDEELSFINSLDCRDNIGNKISVENSILDKPEMGLIRDWIQNCLREYFDAAHKPVQEVELKITQSWVNFSEPGQFHHKHAHQNSLVSGVFYLKTNLDDRINFYRSGHQELKVQPKELNIYNSDSWWLEAIEGQLILFPSWLHHAVPNVQGKDTRVSLAFNTFPTGLLGDELTSFRLDL